MDPVGEKEEACVEQRRDKGPEGTTIVQPLVASRCTEEPGRGDGRASTAKGERGTEEKARELDLLLGWRQGLDPLASCAGGSTLQGVSSQSLPNDEWACFPPPDQTECTSEHATVALGNGKVSSSHVSVEHEDNFTKEESSDVFQKTPTSANSAHTTTRFAYHSISMKSTSSDEFGEFDWQGPSLPSQAPPAEGIPLPEQWQLLCKEIFPSVNTTSYEVKQKAGDGSGCVCGPSPLSRLAEGSP